MNLDLAKRIEELTLEMVSVKSVVESAGEIDSSNKVYEILSRIDYFKDHPDNLYFIPVKNDALGRKVVVSILNGEKGNSKKTVVLIGHTDTVGVSDYGNLQEYATKPFELMEKFKSVALPKDVREDLESGEYLFGRGIFDMKSGDASIIAIMEDIAENIKDFEGNIIFGAVCDEEGNSQGMLNFVPELTRLKREKGYDYQAVLDTDYMTVDYQGDPNKYVHIGTVGKIMPTFFIVGKEAHVGEGFMALDPNQISSRIVDEISLNPEYSEIVDGEVTLPPIVLKQRDLKTEYSCQTAKKSILMYHYATHSETPDVVLKKMAGVGQKCFEEVCERLNAYYKKHCEMAKRPYNPRPWKARTLTYQELYEKVRAEVGPELDSMVKEYAAKLHADLTIDARDATMKVVDFVYEMWSDKDPVMIVFITPPYYPHIYVEGSTEIEKNTLNAVSNALETTETDYNLVYKKFLPCISDLSYAAAPREPEAVDALKSNVPGYGVIYELPINDMLDLNLPVIDIGAFGKDAHQYTERIEKKYTFNVTPTLVYKTILNLLK